MLYRKRANAEAWIARVEGLPRKKGTPDDPTRRQPKPDRDRPFKRVALGVDSFREDPAVVDTRTETQRIRRDSRTQAAT